MRIYHAFHLVRILVLSSNQTNKKVVYLCLIAGMVTPVSDWREAWAHSITSVHGYMCMDICVYRPKNFMENLKANASIGPGLGLGAL